MRRVARPVVFAGALAAQAGCAMDGGVSTLKVDRARFSCEAEELKLSVALRAQCARSSCLPVEFHLPSSERVVILSSGNRERLDNSDIHHEFGPLSLGAGPAIRLRTDETRDVVFKFPPASEPGLHACANDGACKVQWCFGVVFGQPSDSVREVCGDSVIPRCGQ